MVIEFTPWVWARFGAWTGKVVGFAVTEPLFGVGGMVPGAGAVWVFLRAEGRKKSREGENAAGP